MELKAFTKQVIHSAQDTINHELDAHESELHKTTERLLDAVMKKMVSIAERFPSAFQANR